MKKGAAALLGALGGITAGVAVSATKASKDVKEQKNIMLKNDAILKVMNQWLLLKQEGKTLEEYFKENDYKTAAIYGMSFLGERLYDELKNTEVKVLYGIDKNADNIYHELDICSPDEDLAEVDVVIVTAVYYFDEIEDMLCEEVDCPIVSLEDVVYEI